MVGRGAMAAAAVLLAMIGCEKEMEDVGAHEASGSDGDAAEGPSLIMPNGHPLDWLTDDADALRAEDETLQLVNARRVSMGLNALLMQVTHRRVARGHSRHMRADSHQFFEHDNPEGLSPGDRLHASGVRWNFTAENIASGQLTPQEVFIDWINSPGHREHIDDPKLRRTGVGYQTGAGGGDYATYWTQIFTD